MSELTSALTTIVDTMPLYTDMIAMGDFNINYRKRSNPQVSKLKDFEKTFALKQIINVPTRVTHKTSSIIDLTFTKYITHITSSGVLKVHISDHDPTYVRKKKPKQTKEFIFITRRNYKNYNPGIFCDALEGHWRWAKFWEPLKTANELWTVMLEIFKAVADLLYPRCVERGNLKKLFLWTLT